MAVINENNISGREVALVLKAKPVLRPVEGVMMRTHDLWDLCNNDNINKFCKFRPGRRQGILTSVAGSGNPQDLFEVKNDFVNKPLDDARLADFAGYDSECVPPIVTLFPRTLPKKGLVSFSILAIESDETRPQFGMKELYQQLLPAGGNYYFGVYIKNITRNIDDVFISSNQRFLDLNFENSPLLYTNDEVDVLYFITDLPPSEVDLNRECFSIWWSEESNYALRRYKVTSGITPVKVTATLNLTNFTGSRNNAKWDAGTIDFKGSATGGTTTFSYRMLVETNNARNGVYNIKQGRINMPAGLTVVESFKSGDINNITNPDIFKYDFTKLSIIVESIDTGAIVARKDLNI